MKNIEKLFTTYLNLITEIISPISLSITTTDLVELS